MATTIIDFIPGLNTLKLAKQNEHAIIDQARKTAKEIARLEPDAPSEASSSGKYIEAACVIHLHKVIQLIYLALVEKRFEIDESQERHKGFTVHVYDLDPLSR